MMARVNKVIISAHAVLANGGLVTSCGGRVLALAARHHKVPVLVTTALYKLCPQFPTGDDTVNDMQPPSAVLGFDELRGMAKVEVISPGYDYIPPDEVGLLLTDNGGAQPSYVYRLLAENYNRDDYKL